MAGEHPWGGSVACINPSHPSAHVPEREAVVREALVAVPAALRHALRLRPAVRQGRVLLVMYRHQHGGKDPYRYTTQHSQARAYGARAAEERVVLACAEGQAAQKVLAGDGDGHDLKDGLLLVPVTGVGDGLSRGDLVICLV